MFLKRITFTKPLVRAKKPLFSKDETIEFHNPITLLVGDQGCGKSSLLQVLRGDLKTDNEIECDRTTFFAFDTEKDNPRTKGYLESDSAKFGFQIGAKFSSHGQTIFALMQKIKQAKNCLFFIDEPESGLSIRSQYKLLEIIRKAVKRNVQFVIATHSIVLIQGQEEVFDLEKRIYSSSQDFLQTQQ